MAVAPFPQRGPRSQAAHTQNMPSGRRCIWNDSTARSSHHPADMAFLSWHQWCEKEGSGALLWSWWRFICLKNPLFLTLDVNGYVSGRSGSGFPAHSEAVCGCRLILRSRKRSTLVTYWASQFKNTTNTFAGSSPSRLVPSNDFSSSRSPSVALPCFAFPLCSDPLRRVCSHPRCVLSPELFTSPFWFLQVCWAPFGNWLHTGYSLSPVSAAPFPLVLGCSLPYGADLHVFSADSSGRHSTHLFLCAAGGRVK